MNISTHKSPISAPKFSKQEIQSQENQSWSQPTESVTLSESGSGRNPVIKAIQGAAIGYMGHSLGGGSWWKAGLIGAGMRGTGFYIEGRIAAHQAVKNGDVPGGLGVGTVMGRMAATAGVVTGFPTFAVTAACANLCGGGPVAHAIAGAVGNVLTS